MALIDLQAVVHLALLSVGLSACVSVWYIYNMRTYVHVRCNQCRLRSLGPAAAATRFALSKQQLSPRRMSTGSSRAMHHCAHPACRAPIDSPQGPTGTPTSVHLLSQARAPTHTPARDHHHYHHRRQDVCVQVSACVAATRSVLMAGPACARACMLCLSICDVHNVLHVLLFRFISRRDLSRSSNSFVSREQLVPV